MTLNEYSLELYIQHDMKEGDIVYYEGYLSNGIPFGWGLGKIEKITIYVPQINYLIIPFDKNEHKGEVVLNSPSYKNDVIIKIG